MVEFYRRVMGLEFAKQEFSNLELNADSFCFFFDQIDLMGPIMEFFVRNLDKAVQELVKAS